MGAGQETGQYKGENRVIFPDKEEILWAILFLVNDHFIDESEEALETAIVALQEEVAARFQLLPEEIQLWEERKQEILIYLAQKIEKMKTLNKAVERGYMQTLVSYIQQPGVALNHLLDEKDRRKADSLR